MPESIPTFSPLTVLSAARPPEQQQPIESDVAGLPKQTASGEPIIYRWSEVAPVRSLMHRGTQQPFEITPERASEWARNVDAMNVAGHPPFVTKFHLWGDADGTFREPSADETLAHIAKVKQDSGRVWALTGYYGQESFNVAARNKFSIGIAENVIDSSGKKYPGETLHHISSTPDSAFGSTGEIRVAASAGPTMVSVYETSERTYAPVQPNTMRLRAMTAVNPLRMSIV